ncbi:sterol desaturase family protein [Balneola sp. MJW-20]|uniref:sterol desaturase family protein n=1 Tax=Gracilimonas aurantiaca TaxID=3234185 RepID=UPI003467DBAD
MEIKEEGQGRLFKSAFLEKFTKTSPKAAWTLYAIIGSVMLVFGFRLNPDISILAATGIIISGLFFWTFYEYLHHRYINHLDDYFPESDLACRIAYTLHGIHHEYPRDEERVVLPPAAWLLLAGAYTGLFWLAIGPLALLFCPGFLFGYLGYSMIHALVHKTHIPKPLRGLYRHHAIHHYKYPDKAYGVSTMFWDRVFRTMPPE